MPLDRRVEALSWRVPKESWDEHDMPTLGVELTLERGGWWDILPEQHRAYKRAAERYLERNRDYPLAARQRVWDVWIGGKYRPAWELGMGEETPEQREARLARTLAEPGGPVQKSVETVEKSAW